MPARRGLSTSPSIVSFQIPPELLAEFGREARVVVRHPWVVGIPVPERLLTADVLKKVVGKEFEVILIPKAPIVK